MTPTQPNTDVAGIRALLEKATPLIEQSVCRVNIPEANAIGIGRTRVVGFRLHEADAGLSDGLFMLDALIDLHRALPGLLDRLEKAEDDKERWCQIADERAEIMADRWERAVAAEARSADLERQLGEARKALKRVFSVTDPSKSGPSATKIREARTIIRAVLSPEASHDA